MQTIRTNLFNGAPTQYTNCDLQSMCVFNGAILGAGASGIRKLCCGTSDDGTAIGAYFKTFALKLGHEGKKRVRFLYLNIETDGEVIVTPIVDGVEKSPITFTSNGNGLQMIRKTVARSTEGVYWQFKIENVAGCWFSLDKVEVLPVNLSRGR